MREVKLITDKTPDQIPCNGIVLSIELLGSMNSRLNWHFGSTTTLFC